MTELFILLAPAVLVVVALAILVRRGVRTGEIRRLNDQERQALQDRGVSTRWGTMRTLNSEERQHLRDGSLARDDAS